MPEIGEPFNPYKRFHNALIPESIVAAAELSQGAKLLWGVLRRYAGQDGVAWPKQGRLAADLKVGERTVRRWLSVLVREGYIRTTRRGTGRFSSAYEFLWKTSYETGQMSLELAPDRTEVSGLDRTELSGLAVADPYSVKEGQFEEGQSLRPGTADGSRGGVVENCGDPRQSAAAVPCETPAASGFATGFEASKRQLRLPKETPAAGQDLCKALTPDPSAGDSSFPESDALNRAHSIFFLKSVSKLAALKRIGERKGTSNHWKSTE